MRGATRRQSASKRRKERFQSTLLMRGATRTPIRMPIRRPYFNPRSSCEERHYTVIFLYNINNFNPRSSCEERQLHIKNHWRHDDFNPRSSCEERRPPSHPYPQAGSYFNPRSSCEERHRCAALYKSQRHISIHAPHARSDKGTLNASLVHPRISIHAPHARSDSIIRYA